MRIFFDIMLFTAVLFAPFWCLLIISAVGILMIPRWYEVIGAYALYEFLFLGSFSGMSPFLQYVPLPIYALVLLLLNEWVRGRVRERTI